MTTALVLGGSGLLGRHVVAALREDPRVGRVVAPGRDTLDVVRAGTDELAGHLATVRPQVVVACTGRLDGSGAELIEANTLVTAKLLDALAGTSARFVRIGSAGEYGPVREGTAAHEDGPVAPVGEYGLSHLTATRLVAAARHAGRVDGLTLRVFNPVGPGGGDRTVLGRAATLILEALRDGASTVRMGPLSAYRDFVDARDVAQAVVEASFATPTHATVNIGSGRAVRIRDAVRVIAGHAGWSGLVLEANPDAGRSTGVDWMLADIRRARDEFGWLPAYRLEDSLSALWADVSASGLVPR